MTSTDPLVSVIVPCYDSARTLALCLRSVAAQTYRPIETIVVDDGSTDGSPEIAASLGAVVLRTGANRGPSVARNVGAEHARGEILFFLDSDVALEDTAVATAVAALRADPGLAAVCGVYHPEPLLTPSLAARYRSLQIDHFWMDDRGVYASPHTSLFIIRAEVFAQVGPFHPDLRHTEPLEYGQRLRRHRHRLRFLTDVRGRHDHETTLRELLPKVFRRAHASMLGYQRDRELGGTRSQALSSALALAAVLALPLPLVTMPAAAVVPVALAGCAVALDAGLYRRALAAHGLGFALYVVVAHLLYQTAAGAGATTGALRRLGQRLRAGRSLPVATR